MMKFNQDQKKTAYQNLSEEARDVLMSVETSEKISVALEIAGVIKKDESDSEVMYAMLGLQSLDEAVNNIRSFAPEANLTLLKTELEREVFSKIPMSLAPVQSPSPLPVTEPNEVAHDTTPEEKVFMNTPPPLIPEEKAPETLNLSSDTAHSTPVTFYPVVDPYREPLE